MELVQFISRIKKILILFLLFFFSCSIQAQRYSNCYLDGFWGKWQQEWLCHFSYFESGNTTTFIIYEDDMHNYLARITIYYILDKKEKKSKKYLEYTGNIEYFVNEYSPNMESQLSNYKRLVVENRRGEKKIDNVTVFYNPKKHGLQFLTKKAGWAIEGK